MNKLSLFICCGALLFVILGCGGTDKNTANKTPSNTKDAPSTKTSQDYLNDGNIAFKAKDYKAAIAPYQKALELEKQNQKLEKKWWFILIDNLTLAYGISGDNENARATAEYGISKDPTYPLFYYNLACTYGEDGDEDATIKNIQMAYKYKANILEGEQIPDPLNDSSFKKFRDSDKFKKAVAELKR